MNLIYKSNALIDDLAEGECTIHRSRDANGAQWWTLWFYVRRDTDGEFEHFAVPINPGGSASEGGPAVRVWGFTQTTPWAWQVSPSINVLNTGAHVHGEHDEPSLWHQTPEVIDVYSHEAWMP